jgi:hypothetical protein
LIEKNEHRSFTKIYSGLGSTRFADDSLPITMLSGNIVNQVALHGLLRKIENMNLTLVSVNKIIQGNPDE